MDPVEMIKPPRLSQFRNSEDFTGLSGSVALFSVFIP
jgi:hypothetical protein